MGRGAAVTRRWGRRGKDKAGGAHWPGGPECSRVEEGKSHTVPGGGGGRRGEARHKARRGDVRRNRMMVCGHGAWRTAKGMAPEIEGSWRRRRRAQKGGSTRETHLSYSRASFVYAMTRGLVARRKSTGRANEAGFGGGRSTCRCGAPTGWEVGCRVFLGRMHVPTESRAQSRAAAPCFLDWCVSDIITAL